MEIRPLDFAEMATHRVRHHQVPAGAVRAESMDHLEDVVGGFFARSTTTRRRGWPAPRRPRDDRTLTPAALSACERDRRHSRSACGGRSGRGCPLCLPPPSPRATAWA